jgi:hypothetical protein
LLLALGYFACADLKDSRLFFQAYHELSLIQFFCFRLEDARQWLNAKIFGDIPHPKTGATALHVAAAKGYTKVSLKLGNKGWGWGSKCIKKFALYFEELSFKF